MLLYLYNMILERKGSDIATLMAQLELEVDQYFVDPSCVHKWDIEHYMPAKNGTDIETKLQGFKIYLTNQRILGNMTHMARWNLIELDGQCITLTFNYSMDIVQVEMWIVCRTIYEIEI
jgi:hypothetical protein